MQPDPGSVPTLGRLQPVDPRSIWANEARDLTPWLLEHKEHMADALNIVLELSAAEHPVGGFSLDLVGRDLTHDAVLIVENQLEGSDHSHLGQLLTYAAGTGAATIVWVATDFREEHRQALDWLNEHTEPDVRFFGIQLEVVRIGESLPAPVLNVVVQPNDWQKQVRSATQARAGTRAALYAAFWTRFLDRIHREHQGWTRSRKPPSGNWLWVAHPLKGIPLSVSFVTGGSLSVELYIDSVDPAHNLRLYQAMLGHKADLEATFGRELMWEEQPGRRYCRVADRREADVSIEDEHDEFIDWIFDSMGRWRKMVATLPADVKAIAAGGPSSAATAPAEATSDAS